MEEKFWTNADIEEFETQNGVVYEEVVENEEYEICEYGF